MCPLGIEVHEQMSQSGVSLKRDPHVLPNIEGKKLKVKL
ncbi:UNVERIFIED_CONTAM: hypothetical protein NCL1_55007 [Trichonephila clavipes]